ncbi:MAG: hypothetical protein HQ546_05945 [Planctomycetes bacterium]|nr:hypothetical protein [Planctomycetota bacterium]
MPCRPVAGEEQTYDKRVIAANRAGGTGGTYGFGAGVMFKLGPKRGRLLIPVRGTVDAIVGGKFAHTVSSTPVGD